jgi:hypothetical protein
MVTGGSFFGVKAAGGIEPPGSIKCWEVLE